MTRVKPVLKWWLTPPLVLLLTACTAAETPRTTADGNATSPFVDCAALLAVPGAVGGPSASGSLSTGAAEPGASPDGTSRPQAAGSALTAAGPASAAEPPTTATPASAGGVAAPVSAGGVAAPASSASMPDASGIERPASGIPAVSLPCFTGGANVALGDLRGPAVINLWASSCAPCRQELPIMQELADRTAGRLHVIGVDTFDSRDAGASFAADKGVSFATLFDPDKKLLTALGKINLPVTVFLDADGQRRVYSGKALDRPVLGDLVKTYTGVTVTG